MPRQFIKGNDNRPFEIIEDDRNIQSDNETAQKTKLHRYDAQLNKLSKATKDTLRKNK